MIALMHMIGEGVFDRYPKLKVGFMEGACGWVPPFGQNDWTSILKTSPAVAALPTQAVGDHPQPPSLLYL